MSEAKQLLHDLEKLLTQFEAAIHAGAVGTSEHSAEAAAGLKEGLKHARARVEGLRQSAQDQIGHGIETTDQWVRGQPWLAVGIAAVIAFAVGIAIGRRD